jgi:hypothetical protein
MPTQIIAAAPRKSKATTPAAIEIKLPKTIQVSDEERVWVVRLIRLLRDDYWATELVRQILSEESQNTSRLSIKDVFELLKNMEIIETLASNAIKLGNNWSNHPVLKAIRKEWPDDEICEYKSQRAVRQLIESATRKDGAR